MRFVEKLNMPATVAVVLVFFLAIDGFLFYNYQRPFPSGQDDAATNGPSAETVEDATTTAETAAPENTRERTEETAEFVHRAVPQNIVNNSTYIEDPSTVENPDAILLVERISEPGGNAGNTRPVGVWYDAYRGGNWAVFNQDLAPMSEGTTFDVKVWGEPGGDVFFHRATSDNTVGNETYVDHPSVNENPGAVFSVTPNWNPGGGAGTYVNHPVGVRYDAGEEKWAILNIDLSPMPERAAFNVVVSEGTATRLASQCLESCGFVFLVSSRASIVR